MKIHSIVLWVKGYLTIKRSIFIFNCLLLCLAVWLGGMLVAGIVENEFLTIPHQKVKFIPRQESAFDKPRKFNEFSAIIKYNVFDAEVSREPIREILEPVKSTPGDQLSQMLSNLKLLGIGSSSGNSFCIIRNMRLKKEDVFRKGEEVVFTVGESSPRSGLVVSRIVNRTGNQKVYLKLGNKVGILEYQEETLEKTKPSPVRGRRLKTVKKAPEPTLKSSYSTDGQNYYIDSTEVDVHLNNFAKLLNQARMIPHFDKGKHQGYKVKAIDKGSLYEKLGLRNNDIITEVNGEALDSGEKVMSLFKQLRNEREFSVKVRRRGTPMVFNIYVN